MKLIFIFLFCIFTKLLFPSDSATIGVPAQLLIHPQSNALVIEYYTDSGNWEPVSSTITFDHGTVVAGEIVSVPVILKNFRIRRTNNSNLGGSSAIIDLATNKDDNFASTDIAHSFMSSSESYSASKSSMNFTVTSNIKTAMIPSTTPSGVYQKTTQVTAFIMP